MPRSRNVVWAVVGLLVGSVALAPADASVPLAAAVSPKLQDLPGGQGWLAGPSPAFDPQHPPVLFCRGRSPGFPHLAASQVALPVFVTTSIDALTSQTFAFGTVDAARSWYSREVRPGFASCVIRGAQEDAAATGTPQGVNGSLKLVRSKVVGLHVGMQAYQLTATFRLSSGEDKMHVWSLARYGRVVFVVHGFWFPQGTPISVARLLAKVIARTPSH